jgi:hypothetical protein
MLLAACGVNAGKVTTDPAAPACTLPNLVGMKQQAVEAGLQGMGLSVVKVYELSTTVQAGLVSAQQPPAETRLEPCKGVVTITVSAGEPVVTPWRFPTPVPSTPTNLPAPFQPGDTPVPTSIPTRPVLIPTAQGTGLKDSEIYDLIYLNNFVARDVYGLLKEVVWQQAGVGSGSKVNSIAGRLNVTGNFELYSRATFPNRVRVLLGGNTFGIGIKEFSVFVNYLNSRNTLRMGCSDQPAAAGGLALFCDWFQVVNGSETRLTNVPIELCSGECNLQIEIEQGDIRVYANDAQRLAFRNTTYSAGQMGLRIDAPAGTPFKLDRVVVYEIPKGTTAKVLLREDFGDDIVTNLDGQSISGTLTLSESFLAVNVQSKEKTYYIQQPYNSSNLPTAFQLNLSTRAFGGAKTAAIGLVYRYLDPDNFYAVFLSNEGKLEISVKIKGQWVPIFADVTTAGYRAGETNVLSIRGNGSRYVVSVNDKQVKQFSDETLPNGSFGFGLRFDNPNDHLQAEIYLLEARRP